MKKVVYKNIFIEKDLSALYLSALSHAFSNLGFNNFTLKIVYVG